MPDASRAAGIEALAGHAYAHRGLHGADVPENSLAAFRAAIDAGLGIECDIRKSGDGRAIVFHDAQLDRLTARTGKTSMRSVGELTRMTLAGSEECIPTLRDMLEAVDARVPLLLELKSDDRSPIDALCHAVRRDVQGYGGAFGVMSFDPRIPAWFAAHAADVPRGLVVSEQDNRTFLDGLKRRAAVSHAVPDFLALDIRDLPSRLSRRQLRKGRALFSWTVRTAQQLETALESGAAPILEGDGVAAWRADA